MTAAARALLASIVDYAGLFPPAALPLQEAVAEYARWRRSDQSWLLGRFVLPAKHLGELARLLEDAPDPGDPWPLSALVAAEDTADDVERVLAWNRERARLGRVDSVELRASTPAEAAVALAAATPADALARYVELPLDGDPGPMLSLLRERGSRAKVRAGGSTPASVPEPARLARFIAACASAGVAFKATAGLHHPLRGEHPLSDAPGAPRATLHGFLNLFAAAALARAGAAADLEAVLRDESASAFRLDDDGLGWRRHRVATAALAECRSFLAVSFGSCSFAEPLAGLRGLGVLA